MRTTNRGERLKAKNLNKIYILDSMTEKELTSPFSIDTNTRNVILTKTIKCDFIGMPNFFKVNGEVLGQFSTDKSPTEEDCHIQLRTNEDNFKVIVSALEDHMAKFFIQ